MKVQTRLSLFSSIIFGIIFIVISVFIYALYFQNAKRTIYDNLKKTSYITALFYLEEDELNKNEFAEVKTQFREFVTNSYYQICNEGDSISYGSSFLKVSPQRLDAIRKKGSSIFSEDDFLCYGIFYEDNQGDFVVVTGEKKETLYEQLNALLWILLNALWIGMVAIVLLSRWVANIAYRPFRKVIQQVNNISTHNLEVQIELPDTKDELQDLINTFNELLTKISDTFIIQKNFVNYVSHEFRTPLASMLGNLEVFSIRDRTPEEYDRMSQKLIQEIHQLEEILNTLIVVSDLRKEANDLSCFRMDELIWQIIGKITERDPLSKIVVNLEITPEDEPLLYVQKNRVQMLMALFNLIENAVKYSQGKAVEIRIYKENETLCLSIEDKGIGIPEDQLININKPFYRAGNTTQIRGEGIGLSIALRILEKNRTEYTIDSEENRGTTVLLKFKEELS